MRNHGGYWMCTFCAARTGETLLPNDKVCTLTCSDGRKNIGEGWGTGFAVRLPGGILAGTTEELVRHLDFFVEDASIREIWVSLHRDCRFACRNNIPDGSLRLLLTERAAQLRRHYADRGILVREFLGELSGTQWIYAETTSQLVSAA